MNGNDLAPTRRAFTFGISVTAGGILAALHPMSSFAALPAALKNEPQESDSETMAWIGIDYRALRMNEMPRVKTYFLSSGNRYTNEWGGVGEPGTPPLAPAIANAVFAATGRRIRCLPLANHTLRDSQVK